MIPASNAVAHEPAPINQKMWLGAARMANAIAMLSDEGFVVTGMEYSGSAAPTVQVLPSEQCNRLIEAGDATYFYMGGNGLGRHRKGQFHVHGVRVIWVEAAH